jgi:hypothetical protein
MDDRLDEIIKRLARIEKHLGIPDEPPPPHFLPVIQYHHFHVDIGGGVYASALCGFPERRDEFGIYNRLWIQKFQEVIDGGNSHVLCPQCYRIFQEKYSREVVRGIYLSLKGNGSHRERVLKVMDLLGLPADRVKYDGGFWRSCLTLKYWRPDDAVK